MIYATSGQSTYCYPNSDTLINNFGLQDHDRLTMIDTDLTLIRLAELYASPITGRFSLSHLLKIHKYLFKDIYPFAGKTRNENIIKGSTRFCSCEHIYDNFNTLYESLKNENFLKDLSLDKFCERLAYYMSELNMLHPFREGNGRTTREYIRLLALYNHHILNWDAIDNNCLLEAMIVSVNKDYSALIKCIFDAIEK